LRDESTFKFGRFWPKSPLARPVASGFLGHGRSQPRFYKDLKIHNKGSWIYIFPRGQILALLRGFVHIL
jgi:hypothetical protein